MTKKQADGNQDAEKLNPNFPFRIGSTVRVKKQGYLPEFVGKTGKVTKYFRFPVRPHWFTVTIDGKEAEFRDVDIDMVV